MPRELYQDVHPEVDCDECGGAGFFGSGDIVEPCDFCRGTGVLVDYSVLLSPRKPIRRATTLDQNSTRIDHIGGER